VKIWYYAGELDERFLSGETCQPLSDYWAHTWLRQDFARAGQDETFAIDADQLANPFGTTRGAIMAWQRVSKLNQKQFSGVAI
jgi:hypothetical protein